ncbi:MAG: hypothetical protein WBE20_12830 [Candidatus Acidiferrales bacterium]
MTEVSVSEVEAALRAAFEKPDYYCDRVVPEGAEARIRGVHAKRVLRDVFGELSEQRVRYNETEHGPAITEWVIANAPDELNEIRDLLDSLVPE